MNLSRSSAALMLIALATLVMTLVSVLIPGLDLALARGFYDPVTHRFPAAAHASWQWLREQGPVTVIAVIGGIAGTLLAKLLWPRRPLLIPGRAIIFLTLTLAIGPGLMVNVVFKPHWGRPRPVEVTQFGGHDQFVPWWDPHGSCPHNCSFMSGELSIAAWLYAPAVLLPPPWRVVGLGAVTIFTAIVGILRMAYGGHFLTDVVFGALMTALVIWLVHGLIYRWPRTGLDERVIDKRLDNFTSYIRRTAFGARHDNGSSNGA